MKNTIYCSMNSNKAKTDTTSCINSREYQPSIPRAHGSRITNALKEYKKRFVDHGSGNEGAFFVSDVYDIERISNNIYDLISNALRAGFIIGFRKGKADAKKKNQQTA